MDKYPRTCRNGHEIEGPDYDHQGAHRQCWRCRRASQERADEKYNATARGAFIRRTYELSTRMFVNLRSHIASTEHRLAALSDREPHVLESDDRVPAVNDRLAAQRKLGWCDAHVHETTWVLGTGYVCPDCDPIAVTTT